MTRGDPPRHWASPTQMSLRSPRCELASRAARSSRWNCTGLPTRPEEMATLASGQSRAVASKDCGDDRNVTVQSPRLICSIDTCQTGRRYVGFRWHTARRVGQTEREDQKTRPDPLFSTSLDTGKESSYYDS